MRSKLFWLGWFAVLAFILGLGSLPGSAAPQIKQVVAADPWAVTSEDDNAAILTYLSTTGDVAVKVRAAIRADRLKVKARVPAVEVQPEADAVPSRIMVDRINDDLTTSKHVLDLAAYDSVDFAADGRVVFGIGGFNVVKVKGTAALGEHLKGYYKYADVSK